MAAVAAADCFLTASALPKAAAYRSGAYAVQAANIPKKLIIAAASSPTSAPTAQGFFDSMIRSRTISSGSRFVLIAATFAACSASP